MTLVNHDGLKYFHFDTFPDERIGHGIFSRHGGISPDPWSSLNLGGLVGDQPDRVLENKKKIFQLFQRPVESTYDVWQVHSADVVCTQGPRSLTDPHVRADAILTNNSSVTLVMRFADCVPVLLYDPTHHAVGIIHAGWQGTVKFVVGEAVRQMTRSFGSDPADLLAGIGPSIGPDHYEIGKDVIDRVESAFGPFAAELLIEKNDHTHFDLWQANRRVLEQAGVKNIEIAEICTACHREDWFSHRAELGHTGRFGAVIFLKN
jgi:YfiH family protein